MNDYQEINAGHAGSEDDDFTEERYRLFNRFLPASAVRILDIGCNTGRGGSVLKSADKGRAIVGLDVVESRLARLPPDVYAGKIHGSCTDIPAGGDSFDAVVAGEFIEHVYPEDVDKVLSEIFRVLKVGGVVLMTTPNPDGWKRRIMGESVLGGPHVSQHDADGLGMKLRTAGFSGIRVYGSGRATRYLGCHFPFLGVYGSYLIKGVKR